MRVDVWTYREAEQLGADPTASLDISGFSVEALDGSIGKVSDATYEVGASHIVVNTGPWIFGKEVMLPAGVIERIDQDSEKVFVNRTKDQIKDAPEYDDSLYNDERYRGELGAYYEEGAGRDAGQGWEKPPY